MAHKSDWKSNLSIGLCVVLIIAVVGSCTHMGKKSRQDHELEMKKQEVRLEELKQQIELRNSKPINPSKR